MRSKHLMFILLTSLMFAACDAGKYYARKKINHHYEEISANKTTEDHGLQYEKTPGMPQEEAITQDQPTRTTSAATSRSLSAPVKNNGSVNHKPVLPFSTLSETPHEEQNISTASSPHQKHEVKKVSGEKTVGKGLLMILVALLLLLLGILFVAALGEIGLIFAIIFYIGAAVLIVAGIIVMFMNN